jgi:hypothetical protein
MANPKQFTLTLAAEWTLIEVDIFDRKFLSLYLKYLHASNTIERGL